MRHSKAQKSPNENLKFFSGGYLSLAVVSLGALAATFLVSNLNFSFGLKFSAFVLIVFLYVAYCLTGYNRQKRAARNRQLPDRAESIFGAETEAKLLALEEANQFFGASLKSDDMFRLVASRVQEIIPFAACALFLAEEDESKLKVSFAVGDGADKFVGIKISPDEGLAGKTFQNKSAAIFDKAFLSKDSVSLKSQNKFGAAIAVPLFQNGKVFGVLVLYGAAENAFDRSEIQLCEAVGARVSPLFVSAKSFENNLANSLTDALTDLPNERAFYLILENQIAQSQRFRDERPLTILTIDIKDFDELNGQYGHLTGDRILEYAADLIKKQLRQMDFLARARADEFLAVLPTASEEITREIVERVERAFRSKPFAVAGRETVYLQLNFGAASFLKDGENAASLLNHALLRKQQSKTTGDNKVLWFPKEYVN